MKWQSLHPEPDRYDFKVADAFLHFAQKKDDLLAAW
jgi:GH35 family endo-1,4-beta-xylanase